MNSKVLARQSSHKPYLIKMRNNFLDPQNPCKYPQIPPKIIPIDSVKPILLTKNIRQAHNFLIKNDLEKATTSYEKLTLSYPKNLICKVNLAACLIKLNMNERALELLNQCESLTVDNFYVNYNKSVAFYYLNQMQESLKIVEKGLKSLYKQEFLELQQMIEKY